MKGSLVVRFTTITGTTIRLPHRTRARQILKICQKFNDLAAFVGRSGQEGVKQSPEFKQLANLVAEVCMACPTYMSRGVLCFPLVAR